MLENDGMHGDAAYEEAFIDLIDASESRDAGIESFERTMAEEQEDLRSAYLGKKDIDYSNVQAIEDKLNGDWRHEGRIASVTGRVYLADEDLREMLPSEWGEPSVDEEWGPFFFLDDMRLRSQGIDIVPEYDEDGTVLDIKVGFAFAVAADHQELPLLTAFVGELSRHEYELPTPEEAELRLHRLWPEQYALIDHLMHPDLQSSLPRRLRLLEQRLQGELHDERFREYLTLSLDGRLALDQTLPYVTTVSGQVQCFDGDDPDGPESNGEWIDVTVPDKTPLLVYCPSIRFSATDDDSVKAFLWGETYNNEDGDDPEYISVEIARMSGFRSVRSMRSLLGRAVLGTPDDILRDQQAVGEAADALDMGDAFDFGRVNAPERHATSGDPERIQNMQRLEQAFQAAIEYIKSHRESRYTTEEEAYAASTKMIREGVLQQLIEAGVQETYEYEFQGTGILRPRTERNLPDMRDMPHVFVYGVDSEQPFGQLQDGDSFCGIIDSFQPFAHPLVDIQGNVTGYKALPSLLVTTQDVTHSATRWAGVSIVDISVHNRAVVPLDGSAVIKIRELDAYRTKKAALLAVTQEFRNTSLARQLHRLNATFASEQRDFLDMKHVEHFARLDASIKRATAEGKKASVALSALESMFIERLVEIYGTVLEKTDEGFAPVGGGSTDQAFSRATVIDVRNDVINDDVVLVVQEAVGEDVLHYIPIKSIATFRF